MIYRFLIVLIISLTAIGTPVLTKAQPSAPISLDASQEKPTAAPEGKSLTCNNYSFLENMFTDVCWSGLFPIRIMGTTLKGGASPYPVDANKKVLCKCGGDLKEGKLPKIGFSVGMWMPSRLMDITRTPMCFASLGGKSITNFSLDLLTSGSNRGRVSDGVAFYNWVMYSAPLIYILRLLDDSACAPEGLFDFDILQMSVVFPNWNDVFGRYTMFLNPEVMLFANPLSAIAGPVDTAALLKDKRPINRLHWVAGNWGNVYPMYGFGDRPGSIVGFSSLIATRALALTHRLGLVRDTVGEENLCKRNIRFTLRKDSFKWQMVAPSPETSGEEPMLDNVAGHVRLTNFSPSMGTCTHPTGYPPAQWGMWRDVPSTGEDHSYMLFRWTDCCFGLTPGL